MKMWMQALAFFRIVPLHSSAMIASLAALIVFGTMTLMMSPSQGTDVLLPVLLLHTFAVSSGFAVPARRGHFDLLLTGGVSRWIVATTHWLLSAAPGLLAWLALGIVESIVGNPARPAAFASGTIAAVLLISTLGWALSVRLPRLSGGVIWLVVLFVALTVSGDWRATLLNAAEGHSSAQILAMVFVLCPLFLVGRSLDPPEVVAVVPAVAAGVAAVVAACAWIVRMDVTLEVSQ